MPNASCLAKKIFFILPRICIWRNYENLFTDISCIFTCVPIDRANQVSERCNVDNPLGFWPLNGNTFDVTSNGNGGTIKNGAFFSDLFPLASFS